MNPRAQVKTGSAVPKNTCLHLVLRASREVMDECLACIGHNDSIALMDTAVSVLARPDLAERLPAGVRVYCLEADLLARGLGKMARTPRMESIDDVGFVRLVCEHGHCLSWK